MLYIAFLVFSSFNLNVLIVAHKQNAYGKENISSDFDYVKGVSIRQR